MIKKNLFILLCLYLFAIQPTICGLLWGDNRFFWLAIPNFIIILLILIFSNKGKGEKNEELYHNPPTVNESKLYEIKDIDPKIIKNKRIKQGKKFSISNIWFFIISVLAGLFARFRIGNIATHLKLLICVTGSFLVYILLGSIFGSKIFRTKLSVLYIFCLIMAGIRSIINMFNLLGNIKGGDIDPNIGSVSDKTGAVFVDEGKVINTGIIDNSVDTGMILSGTNSGTVVTGEVVVENTGTDIQENNTNEDNTATIKYSGGDNSLATFTDVIKYLLKDSTLLKDTKVAFKNISKTNADYPYFRTAYEKKMIGTDIQPNQKPSCETFVVMKGLAEGWNVGTYSNIKQAYWQYAKENGKLPDCKYGSNIKIGEMK